MIIVTHSAQSLKRFLAQASLSDFARLMVMRVVLAFILHRGRVSCSAAARIIAPEPIHRGQLTRFLARPRWQKDDIASFCRLALLQMEAGKGKFFFLIDATLFSQAGLTTLAARRKGRRSPETTTAGR